MVMIMKLETSVSFRAVAKQMTIQRGFIYELDESPSYTSVKNWVLKIGLYDIGSGT
jgi:hypothetical protein